MKVVCVLPIEIKSVNIIKSVYLHNSTILTKIVDSDSSIFESAKLILGDLIKTDNYSTNLFYVGPLTHDNIRYDCFFFDLTNFKGKVCPQLKKVKIQSIIQSDHKHNDSLIFSLCFKTATYLK